MRFSKTVKVNAEIINSHCAAILRDIDTFFEYQKHIAWLEQKDQVAPPTKEDCEEIKHYKFLSSCIELHIRQYVSDIRSEVRK